MVLKIHELKHALVIILLKHLRNMEIVVFSKGHLIVLVEIYLGIFLSQLHRYNFAYY